MPAPSGSESMEFAEPAGRASAWRTSRSGYVLPTSGHLRRRRGCAGTLKPTRRSRHQPATRLGMTRGDVESDSDQNHSFDAQLPSYCNRDPRPLVGAELSQTVWHPGRPISCLAPRTVRSGSWAGPRSRGHRSVVFSRCSLPPHWHGPSVSGFGTFCWKVVRVARFGR